MFIGHSITSNIHLLGTIMITFWPFWVPPGIWIIWLLWFWLACWMCTWSKSSGDEDQASMKSQLNHLLRLSLVLDLNRLIDQGLTVSCLDYLGLSLASGRLLRLNKTEFQFLREWVKSETSSLTCCWRTICCPAWPPTLPSTWERNKL